jgi:hypothetical protein
VKLTDEFFTFRLASKSILHFSQSQGFEKQIDNDAPDPSLQTSPEQVSPQECGGGYEKQSEVEQEDPVSELLVFVILSSIVCFRQPHSNNIQQR